MRTFVVYFGLIAFKMNICMSSQQKKLVYALWQEVPKLVYTFWTCKPVYITATHSRLRSLSKQGDINFMQLVASVCLFRCNLTMLEQMNCLTYNLDFCLGVLTLTLARLGL